MNQTQNRIHLSKSHELNRFVLVLSLLPSIMPPKHLEQVLVDDPKLAEGLTAFGDFLKTSYFYPFGSYEKCEDSRAPNAWSTVSRKFEPYIKVSYCYGLKATFVEASATNS
jgi:hypothetical protein